MGEIVLAAKITHVPSMFLSEMPGKNQGCRDFAIEGHKKIGQMARDAGADTMIVFDTHWLVNSGYHINANSHHFGCYTSTEFPHFIQNLDYDYQGNAELGARIAELATDKGVKTRSHTGIPSLGLQYGTLVPMRYMNQDKKFKVLEVAAWMYDAPLDSSRIFGEAVREAIEASDSKVAVLASGSLSHRIAPNEVVESYFNKISKPFNKWTDLNVLDMWQQGRIKEFLDILPQYAVDCDGEGHMHDTAMLFGVLGWDKYQGKGELMNKYFESSGTGQCNVVFTLD